MTTITTTPTTTNHVSAPIVSDHQQLLEQDWASNDRWSGISRTYTAADVVDLRGSLVEQHTLAQHGAQRLWRLLSERPYVRALGALTGQQAVQQVKAGLEAIYLSGCRLRRRHLSGHTYPDQSLYPVNSVPAVVRRINNALMRADQIAWANGENRDRPGELIVPIVADRGRLRRPVECLRTDEADDRRWGRRGALGGPVGVGEEVRPPRRQGLDPDPPACSDAQQRSAGRRRPRGGNVDHRPYGRLGRDPARFRCRPRRCAVLHRRAHSGGFLPSRIRSRAVLARAKGYAPYADLIWVETGTPDLGLAREFANGLHKDFPGKRLAYNCSPSFNWKAALSDHEITEFQDRLGELGYVFQFITLAGFHALNHSMFSLAKGYATDGMPSYVTLQEAEFAAEADGYTATRHQAEVGTGYFDRVTTALNPDSETTALSGSTEAAQFH